MTHGQVARLMTACAVIAVAGWALLEVPLSRHASGREGMDLPVPSPPSPIPEDPVEPPAEEETPTFCGESIESASRSLIYVIDYSGSMNLSTGPFTAPDGQTVSSGTRMARAKAELCRSLAGLAESWSFNIVAYNRCLIVFRHGRVYATPAAKAEAFKWVNALDPFGATNTAGACSFALADRENKAIVLLSDGVPNCLDCDSSEWGSADTHREIIRKANTQKATIDCFGIGLQGNASARDFMAGVAADSGGKFTLVD